jgi:acetyl esterase/lipase
VCQKVTCLGLAWQLKKESQKAIDYCKKAIACAPSLGEAHVVLAQVQLEQGLFAEAKQTTLQALKLTQPLMPITRFAKKQLALCEQLLALDQRLAAVLQGQARPAVAELLNLAALCRKYKQHYATAVRFYKEAFAASPALVEDVTKSSRYHAACAAALAAVGAGKDAAQLNAAEKARLRQQALAWLRADFLLWQRRTGGRRGRSSGRGQGALSLANRSRPGRRARRQSSGPITRERAQRMATNLDGSRRTARPRTSKGEMMFNQRSLGVAAILISSGLVAAAIAMPQQRQPEKSADRIRPIQPRLEQSLNFTEQLLARKFDEQMLFRRLEDLAVVDRVRYTGPPPRVAKNPTAPGARNPVIIPAYTFLPRKHLARPKLPLLVYVHGGVHGHLSADAVNVLHELLQQGYAVIAPDYRGSSGYGREYWELIDYGGLEVEDVFAGRQWMLDNHDNLDPERVGILGWSHGGLITLMNLFTHPKHYQAAYAAVPVCDLVARMGYMDQAYRNQFSAPYHIGKTVREDIDEYRRRSPAWQAHKLQSPLLVHTTTNDEDVHVLEVENLIKALKAAGKPFEHKVYQDAPGGHQFNRLDTRLARESRAEAYRFLAKYLKPPSPAK